MSGQQEKTIKGKTESTIRNRKMSLRLTEDEHDKLDHYAAKWGMTKTDLLLEGFDHYIKWVNSDYDLPTAEITRMNQMVDAVNRLAVNQQNTEKSVINGFNAMLGLARGENQFSDKEDGEL